MGREDLQNRRGSSRSYFEEKVEEIQAEVQAVYPLDPSPVRQKVIYQDGMTAIKTGEWLHHKMLRHKGSRLVLHSKVPDFLSASSLFQGRQSDKAPGRRYRRWCSAPGRSGSR